MKTTGNYRIELACEEYRAHRDPRLKGRTRVTLEDGLTLKEAQGELLRLFNEETEIEATNWGMAVIKTKDRVFKAYPTKEDGTRHFTEDGVEYSIIKNDF